MAWREGRGRSTIAQGGSPKLSPLLARLTRVPPSHAPSLGNYPSPLHHPILSDELRLPSTYHNAK